MSKTKIYSYSAIILLLFFGWYFSKFEALAEDFPEHTKVAMRAVGDQLLRTDNDSTTVVLPIVALSKYKYRLEFKNKLSFLPNDLVAIVKENFTKAQLPEHYRVSVLQKSDGEVAYSYEMSANEESTIIPCSGRHLIANHYNIEVFFIDNTARDYLYKQGFLYMMLLVSFLFLFQLLTRKKEASIQPLKKEEHYLEIGSFKFYPTQNKLVKAAQEIGLSKKECELLSIFIEKPNEIIKRDELIKRVWEDNGVIVGRSLDTFISKLRKKLQDDTSIKLSNIHGVGYKLEV
jgi:hypothetical protein